MPFGHGNRCGRSRGSRRRKEREAQRYQARARGCRVYLRVVDERNAAFFQIASSLPGNVVERRAQACHQRDRWRVRALAFDCILPFLAQVKVVARILAGFHCRPRLVADAQIREARRNHDCLLRAANEDVDAPAINVEVRGAEPGDAIDDEQRGAVGLFQQLCDRLNIVAYGRRGFRGLHEYRLVLRLKRGLDGGQVEGLVRKARSPHRARSRTPSPGPSSVRQICRLSAPAPCRRARSDW